MGKPCLLWTGAKSGVGYGMRRRNGKAVLVHRTAYEDAHGPIPAGFEVHHECGVRACYELTHLVALTHTEHKRRHFARTHCSRGHEFTAANTITPMLKNGWLVCRKCDRERRRKLYAAAKAAKEAKG